MSAILIYSEDDKLALELISAARVISKSTGQKIKALCINNNEQAVETARRGAFTFHIKNKTLNPADTGSIAAALRIAVRQQNVSIVLLASNRRGKELAGRLAQKIGAGCLTDVNGLTMNDIDIQCSRNALGGAVVATQRIETILQVIAITPGSFEEASLKADGCIQDIQTQPIKSRIKLIASRTKASDASNIEAAEVLVIAGQGMEKDDIELAAGIAKTLGGEIACSKPLATDKKWFSENRIIGLSGKKCKPQLAIVLGVSGQVQFTVGIRDAHTIVAINNDEKAYIHQIADYAIVGNLKEILPELKKALA